MDSLDGVDIAVRHWGSFPGGRGDVVHA
jgi:hypothetical protein